MAYAQYNNYSYETHKKYLNNTKLFKNIILNICINVPKILPWQ